MCSTRIPLTRGLFALVDDADFALVAPYSWQAVLNGSGKLRRPYAMAQTRVDGRRVNIAMHRLIKGTPPGFETDHRNHDTLDNRRDNLRISTSSQNQANRVIQINNVSGARGVSFDRASGLWAATIRVARRKLWLGRFETVAEASAAYEEAAFRHFGEFAECASRRPVRACPLFARAA